MPVSRACLVWAAIGVLVATGCGQILGIGDLVPPASDDGGADALAGDASRADGGSDTGRDANQGGVDGADAPSEAATGCVIGGTPYASGASNPGTLCESCQPAESTSAWSEATDGTSCGTGGICHAGTCVSGCEIGGVYYAANAPEPGTACQSCQPATSTSKWSDLPDGTACANGEICGNGQCAAQCYIGGTVYAPGANPLNACETCQPATSVMAWTYLAEGATCGSGDVCHAMACVSGCFIGGSYYASGAANPSNPCQACQPATSTTAWTPAAVGSSCGGSGTCSASATCVMPPSCAPGGGGMTNCGPGNESCCTSLEVAGGSYSRTYTNNGSGPTGTADPATVSGFRLDKYPVTVGRFRQFVAAWNGGTGYLPAAGSGKHTHLNGGQGLADSAGSSGTFETGWDAVDWNNTADVNPTNANLACDTKYATWTTSAAGNEKLPINCVNWWEAYAFCIWDGGFLPSEAEWEYAAAGGSQMREYAWGSTAPGTSNQYAIYSCYYPSSSGSCTTVSNVAPVGTATLGAGLWGQLDMAGDVGEWNLDWYSLGGSYVSPCTDCAYLTPNPPIYRVARGGSFNGSASTLLPPVRGSVGPTSRNYALGFRCARTP